MFKNAKYNLIILILGLVFVLGGCVKKDNKIEIKNDKQPVITTDNQEKIDQAANIDDSKASDNQDNNNASTSSDYGNLQNENQNPEKYRETVVEEKDGWKKYTNSKYWGIEFSYIDKDDSMVFYHDASSISLNNKKTDSFIYIDVDDYNSFENIALYDYVKKNWSSRHESPSELISLKKIINNNGLTFVELTTKVKSTQGENYGKYY
ncbi:MAG: hypothetical protein Q7R95_00705, partial [bacterium]|nr:hypothetical protein [bacterium]